GGSTEFVMGSGEVDTAVSMQIGSVRLTERYVGHDPPRADERRAVERIVDEALAEVERRVPVKEARTLVVVAGTATTVQAVALGLEVHDPERVHHSELTVARSEEVLERLAAMTTAQRAALPVMPPGREDVIVAGATILARTLRRFGFERALVSERDI